MNDPFSLRHGQTGLLIFDIVANEGTNTTLNGAVMKDSQPVPLVITGTEALVPVLPPGLYLMEVRCGGATVLYSELEVQPSPLGASAGGQVAWAVNADLTQPLPVVHVVLNEGPRGKQGESAPVDADFSPLSPNPQSGTAVAQAVERQLTSAEAVEMSTPAGNDNLTCNYVELAAAHAYDGTLSAVSMRTAGSNYNNMTTEPIWLAVWEQAEVSPPGAVAYELRGLSGNAVVQAVNQTLTWEFDNIRLHGRRLRLVPTTDRAQTAAGAVMLRPRVSACEDGSQCWNNGNSSDNIPQMVLAGTRYVPRFVPASHETDAEAHLSPEEHAGLTALLAHKDELLALLTGGA